MLLQNSAEGGPMLLKNSDRRGPYFFDTLESDPGRIRGADEAA